MRRASAFFIAIVMVSLQCHAKYQPLLGSEWARKHPNLLPYSKCGFVQGMTPQGFYFGGFENEILGNEIGLIFGGLRPSSLLKPWVLGCVSEKHKLAFLLPIELGTIYFFPSFTANFVHIFQIRFKQSTLHGKTVRDLMKKYHGGGASLGIIFGAGIFGFKNKSEVCFGLPEDPMFAVKIGYAWTSIRRIKYMEGDRRFSPNLVERYGITSSATDAYRESIDWAMLRSLQFVQDKASSL